MIHHLPHVILRFAIVTAATTLMIRDGVFLRDTVGLLWQNEAGLSSRRLCVIHESADGNHVPSVSASFLEHLTKAFKERWFVKDFRRNQTRDFRIANERVFLPRQVEICSAGNFDECVEDSFFCLGVSNLSNIVRVRILLRDPELIANQVYEAHTNILNAFMEFNNHPPYKWEVSADPVSDSVELAQREFLIQISDSPEFWNSFICQLNTRLYGLRSEGRSAK